MSAPHHTPDNLTPEAPQRKRRGWILPAILILSMGLVVVLLGGLIKGEKEAVQAKLANSIKSEVERTNVIALDMTPRPIHDRINLPGIVQPWVSLTVVAEVHGTITARPAKEGQRVAKGAILARIDDRDYRNALASASAAYDMAMAAHKRINTLHADQLATQSQLDTAIAAVKTTRANRDIAALNLERCTIRAALAGVVDHYHVETGQYVGAADPVAALLQLDRVKVVVGVPESDVDRVRQVTEFAVAIDALNNRTFTGTAHHLTRTTSNQARLYGLEIELANPDGHILPDMFARVDIIKEIIPDALCVPLYALINRNNQYRVAVVENDTVRLQAVTIGIQEGWQVEVVDGLNPNDQVVVVGQQDLDDGEPIRITQTVASAEELNQ